MKLPSSSALMYVARLRHIQSIHETPGCRNPDTLVRHFIPIVQRWRSAWIGREELARLRKLPVYYYLVARTKYYDGVLKDAVNDGVRRILIVGCGSDTRPYRFQKLLREKGVRVLECDQPEAIRAKEQMARRWHPRDYVDYLPINLNDEAWPRVEQWLEIRSEQKTLVLIEGVSTYVDESHFCRFLELLATKLSPGSYLCYDYKIRGVHDELGLAGRTRKPFRLPDVCEEVAAFHRERGLHMQHMELSSDLCARLLPELATSSVPFFSEDALVQLVVPDVSTLSKATT
jgi:methyltransferase (TIGR00027 family)